MKARAFVALFLAVAVAAVPMSAAAAAPAVNFGAEGGEGINFYGHSSTETIAEHDLGEMDSPLELYDDDGDVTELAATYNTSQDTPFGVRFDKVEASTYTAFPRVDGESDNEYNWTTPGDWSTTSGASSSMAVTDADSQGVEKVNFDADVASTESATATYADNLSISSDADKRVMMLVLNVNSLGSSSTEVEVRAVDSDGDYRYAVINDSYNASNETVVSNSTADGLVFQEKMSDLHLDTSNGDGTFDGIQKIEVYVAEDNADITVAAVDADRKSTIDFATIERDTDDDGDLESVTFEDYYEGGVASLTKYEFGEELSSATLHDFEVDKVWYRASDLSDSDQHAVEFRDSESSYAKEVDVKYDLEIPNYIDLSHGTLELRVEQGFISDRYGTVEIASDVADDTAMGELNDSDYTDNLDDISSKGSTVTLKTGLSGDTEYRVHAVVYLKDDEASALMGAVGSGPMGDSGGGFFSNPINVILSAVGSLVALVAGRRVFGGG